MKAATYRQRSAKALCRLATLTKNGEVEWVEVELNGSKIPLLELRKHLLQYHAKEGRMHSHKIELEECQYGESGCGSRAGEFLSFARITSQGGM